MTSLYVKEFEKKKCLEKLTDRAYMHEKPNFLYTLQSILPLTASN